MKILIMTACLLAGLVACERAKDTVSRKTKETINYSGKAVATGIGEFTNGVITGIEEISALEIPLSEKMKEKGIDLGKIIIESSEGGTDNQLSVYLIFEQDFKGTLTAVVREKNGLECGRCNLTVQSLKGDAGYYRFTFDERTDIDSGSKVVIDVE